MKGEAPLDKSFLLDAIEVIAQERAASTHSIPSAFPDPCGRVLNRVFGSALSWLQAAERWGFIDRQADEPWANDNYMWLKCYVEECLRDEG